MLKVSPNNSRCQKGNVYMHLLQNSGILWLKNSFAYGVEQLPQVCLADEPEAAGEGEEQ